MTITIRAAVWHLPTQPRQWVARATARKGALLIDPDASRLAIRESWPEAMQAAYKMIADLDRELMDEVHASRASRREAKELSK